jgi:hypothetical protein
MRISPLLAVGSLLGAVLTACSGSDLVLPNEGVAARLEIMGGNGQTATVSATLGEPLVVRVLDSRDRPVSGQPVEFTPGSGSGLLTPAASQTDADGRATAQWVLGPTAGPQSATARPVGNGAPASLVANFTATATPSTAARVEKAAGDNQTATAGTPVAVPPAVRVFDLNDNPVAGVPVTFAVASGGGSVEPATPVSTNAEGVAAAASWRLGAVAGANTLTATVGGTGVSGSPVTFQATGVVGSANRLVFAVQPVNAAVGAAIDPPVQVQIQDASGNVIPGAGGQVTITLGNNPGGATLSGQTTVSASQGVATFANLRLNAPGAGYTLRALASGLTDATSAAFDVVNAQSRIEITGINPGTTVVGQSYTVSYSVTALPPSTGTPTGTVTVSDGSGASCQASVGAGSCQLVSTTRGTKQVVASYTGDGSFAGSASDAEPHTVNPAITTTSITSDAPDPSLFGQQITVQYTVTVNGPGSGAPDGTVTVTFQNGGSCTGPVSAGSGQCALVPQGTGNNRTLTAQYTSASGNFAGSSGTEDHTVQTVATTTAVVSSDASSDFGQPVSFTATVTPEPGGGVPAGSVQFRVDGTNLGSPVAVNSGSATSPTISTLLPGDHAVRAIFNPATGFVGSEATITQNVGLAPTTTTAGTTPSPSEFGQTVAITASVGSSLGPVNAGTVTFYVGGGGCGSGTPLGSDDVSSGSASITTSGLSVQQHRLWACYGGSSGTFTASGDDVLHTVTPAPTTVTITGDNPDPSSEVEPVFIEIELTAASGSVPPTGTISVSADGSTACGPISVSGAGTYSCQWQPGGVKQGIELRATYSGDTNYQGSSSEPEFHDVNIVGP